MTTRTRIVATLGPATDRPGVLEGMIDAGLDVARINFSHGTGEEHRQRIAAFRDASRRLGRLTGILADLPGPKLRALIDAPVDLAAGREVTLAAAPDAAAMLTPTEPELVAHVRPGQRILLDDGRLVLEAVRHDGPVLVARVRTGGPLLPKKGINLPDTDLPGGGLTGRDHAALAVAAPAGIDWLALSFVRRPEAADELRQAAKSLGLDVPVLAKVERPEAVARAEAIIDAFDGIMVARGDLGVELPLEEVPPIQKRLIALARAAGKPVVTATEMLESMRVNPRPTRAEASDVANAIYDGTDAVMLSGETAVGAYPVESVAAMDRIARVTEKHLFPTRRELPVPLGSVLDHITHLACTLARDTQAEAIVVPAVTGLTARHMARHRPCARILAVSPHEHLIRQLQLVWGLETVLFGGSVTPGDDLLEVAVRTAFQAGQVVPGQRLVCAAGHPIEGAERFPTVRVVRVGDAGQSESP